MSNTQNKVLVQPPELSLVELQIAAVGTHQFVLTMGADTAKIACGVNPLVYPPIGRIVLGIVFWESVYTQELDTTV